jgi:hypothetical protein
MAATLEEAVKAFSDGIREHMNKHSCELSHFHMFQVNDKTGKADGPCLMCKKTQKELDKKWPFESEQK